jgi:hypothetical protein
VGEAVKRHLRDTGSAVFAAETLIDSQLEAVLSDTKSSSTNARKMMSRELQRLCSVDVLELIAKGTYRYRGDVAQAQQPSTNKGVFALSVEAASLDNPADVYRFDAADLPIVTRLIGGGILYQLGKSRYYAAAKVESISRNPTNPAKYFA